MFNSKTLSSFRHLCMVCADTIMYLILSAWECLGLMLQYWTECQMISSNADSSNLQEAITILLV